MIAVDTNVLIHAHRAEMPKHAQALQRLADFAQGNTVWGIPVFCMGEFLRVVTHPRLFRPPSSLEEALQALEGLLKASNVRVLSPGPRYPQLLAESIRSGQATGNLVFDAQIAALCCEHAVEGLLTLDRDFSLFPEVRTLNL